MSAQHYRALILAANLLLVALVALLGVRTARGGSPPPSELPPKGFDPTRFAIESIGRVDPSDEFKVITAELDRPDPVAPPRPRVPSGPAQQPAPTVTGIKAMYSLVWVSYVPDDASKSSIILQDKQQQQVALAVGDEIHGFKVVAIQIREEGRDERVAVVTLSGGGKEETIELRRQE